MYSAGGEEVPRLLDVQLQIPIVSPAALRTNGCSRARLGHARIELEQRTFSAPPTLREVQAVAVTQLSNPMAALPLRASSGPHVLVVAGDAVEGVPDGVVLVGVAQDDVLHAHPLARRQGV